MIVINELGTFIFDKKDKAEEFHCDRCNKDKKSKNIISHTDIKGKKQKLCNGCYGFLTSTVKS